MTPAKKSALMRKGWKFGTVAEFLDLTSDEVVEIDRRVAKSENTEALKARKTIRA